MMKQYKEMLEHILKNGKRRGDRTGTGTLSIFGYMSRYDLREGFPAVTTKKLFWKGVVEELMWFLRGQTHIKPLIDKGVNIWNDDAYKFYLRQRNYLKGMGVPGYEDAPMSRDEFVQRIKDGKDMYDGIILLGELGPIYGRQWRHFEITDEHGTKLEVDQVGWLLKEMQQNPESRRLIINSYNPGLVIYDGEVPTIALPACHCKAQFYIQDGELSCMMDQRSGDSFLGVPFNIASYSLMTELFAHELGLGVGEFIHVGGDMHIYLNHIDAVKEQIAREPLPLPKLRIKEGIPLLEHSHETLTLEGYQSHSKIKGELST